MEFEIRWFQSDDIKCIIGRQGSLGFGCYGTVRLGFHKIRGIIAVKCSAMNGGSRKIDQLEKRVKREIGMVQQANHDNIVRVYGWTQWPDAIAIVMEYLPGGNLMEALDDPDVPLEPLLRLRMGYEISNAIAFLHNLSPGNKLVHGDIKAENILLTEDLHCKLSDFGSARLSAYTGRSTTGSRRQYSNQFTELYASPEILENPAAKLKPPHDTYSFSVTMYVVIGRELPIFSNLQRNIYLEKVKRGYRPDLDVINDIIRELQNEGRNNDAEVIMTMKNVMEECWSQNPSDRPLMIDVEKRLHNLVAQQDLVKIQQCAVNAAREMNIQKIRYDQQQCVPLHRFSAPDFNNIGETIGDSLPSSATDDALINADDQSRLNSGRRVSLSPIDEQSKNGKVNINKDSTTFSANDIASTTLNTDSTFNTTKMSLLSSTQKSNNARSSKDGDVPSRIDAHRKRKINKDATSSSATDDAQTILEDESNLKLVKGTSPSTTYRSNSVRTVKALITLYDDKNAQASINNGLSPASAANDTLVVLDKLKIARVTSSSSTDKCNIEGKSTDDNKPPSYDMNGKSNINDDSTSAADDISRTPTVKINKRKIPSIHSSLFTDAANDTHSSEDSDVPSRIDAHRKRKINKDATSSCVTDDAQKILEDGSNLKLVKGTSPSTTYRSNSVRTVKALITLYDDKNAQASINNGLSPASAANDTLVVLDKLKIARVTSSSSTDKCNIEGKSTDNSYKGFLAICRQHSYFYDVISKQLHRLQAMKFDHSLGSAVTFNKEVFVISGRRIKSVEKIKSNDFESGWTEVTSTDQRRDSAASAVCKNYIYTVGGSVRGSVTTLAADKYPATSSGKRYDCHHNSWTNIKNMNERRRGHALAALEGKLYALGGHNGYEWLESAECYDPRTDQWKMIPSMKKKRSVLAAVVLNDEIYAIGGSDIYTDHASVERYNPKSRRWSDVACLNQPRNRHGSCVINDKIYVAGGRWGCNTIEVYDPVKNVWTIENSFDDLEFVEMIVAI